MLAQGLGDRGNVVAVRVDGRIGLAVMSADEKYSAKAYLTPGEAPDIARMLEQHAGTLPVEAVPA